MYFVTASLQICKYGSTGAKYGGGTVSLTTDGASVKKGSKSGLLTQMKNDDWPWLIPVHCANHKIELEVTDAFEAAGILNVNNLHQSIFYLLKNSGAIKFGVHEPAKVLNI